MILSSATLTRSSTSVTRWLNCAATDDARTKAAGLVDSGDLVGSKELECAGRRFVAVHGFIRDSLRDLMLIPLADRRVGRGSKG